MKIFKSIGSILVGFMVVAFLSTITDTILHKLGILPEGPLFDTPLLLLALFYRIVYTVLGGYITARLAPQNPMKHVYILTVIGIVIGSIGAITMREFGPDWYSWGIVVLSIPALWIGGKIYINSLK